MYIEAEEENNNEHIVSGTHCIGDFDVEYYITYTIDNIDLCMVTDYSFKISYLGVEIGCTFVENEVKFPDHPKLLSQFNVYTTGELMRMILCKPVKIVC